MEQRPGTAIWRVVRLRPDKVTQPSLVGGRAVRASARHPSWNSTVCGEPALTRDAGCRSASLVWTCAQLHYLTKRQQRNVDNETTYKTSAMKQPKRSGLAWSHGRDAALLRAVSSRSSTTPTNPASSPPVPCMPCQAWFIVGPSNNTQVP